jgi:hypothetical protein
MQPAAVMTRPEPAAEPSETSVPYLREAQALFAEYEGALKQAEAFHAKGNLEAAAGYAGMAAHLATRPHAGFYASPRLERMLTDIGRRTAEPTDYKRATDPTRKFQRILHVATAVAAVGGLTNMLGHWISQDKTRTHHVALTQHRGPAPAGLQKAVDGAGGQIHFLNRLPGSQIAWAKALRKLSQGFDAVVLHVYSQDAVPMIAFAEPDKHPPVLFLNHGDHLFWLGSSISDVVINLRDAATDLSVTRRGIATARNVMVPTVVAPAVRTKTREEAKKLLGLAPDSIFLFSAARAMKYKTIDGVSFADPHVELLKRHPKAELWVLGAGDPADWKPAIEATGGRIRPMPDNPDTKTLFEAADIYVDSFPFVSSTSMMEAAGLGTPLVSRFYGPKEARIFAINHPGIDKPTLHGWTEPEYVANLDRLIGDADLRERKGHEALESVLYYHTPPSWLTFIEAAYAKAAELAPLDSKSVFPPNVVETFSHGEPDRRMYDVFGFADSNDLLKAYPGLMPMPQRIELLARLRREGVVKGLGETLRMLAPEWIVRRLKDR